MTVVDRQPTSFTGVTHAFLDLAKFTPQVLSARFVVEFVCNCTLTNHCLLTAVTAVSVSVTKQICIAQVKEVVHVRPFGLTACLRLCVCFLCYLVILHMCCIIVTWWGGPGKIEA